MSLTIAAFTLIRPGTCIKKAFLWVGKYLVSSAIKKGLSSDVKEATASSFEKLVKGVGNNKKRTLCGYTVTTVAIGVGLLALSIVQPEVALILGISYVALSLLFGGTIVAGGLYYGIRDATEAARSVIKNVATNLSERAKSCASELTGRVRYSIDLLFSEYEGVKIAKKNLESIRNCETLLENHLSDFKVKIEAYKEGIEATIEETKDKILANELDRAKLESLFCKSKLDENVESKMKIELGVSEKIKKVDEVDELLKNDLKNLKALRTNLGNLNEGILLLEEVDHISMKGIAMWRARCVKYEEKVKGISVENLEKIASEKDSDFLELIAIILKLAEGTRSQIKDKCFKFEVDKDKIVGEAESTGEVKITGSIKLEGKQKETIQMEIDAVKNSFGKAVETFNSLPKVEDFVDGNVTLVTDIVDQNLSGTTLMKGALSITETFEEGFDQIGDKVIECAEEIQNSEFGEFTTETIEAYVDGATAVAKGLTAVVKDVGNSVLGKEVTNALSTEAKVIAGHVETATEVVTTVANGVTTAANGVYSWMVG